MTNGGTNLSIAQQIYGFLYLQSLALTCAIYHQAGGIPNWALLFLPLSKRLHSIFVLRLFNDCWALVAVQAATLAFGGGWDLVGLIFYWYATCVNIEYIPYFYYVFSAALSVKMSVLLYLPAILVILFKRRGLIRTIFATCLIAVSQLAIGYPFLQHNTSSYLKYSFELTRVFLYKWTVNWRFLSEEIFLSSTWARILLVGHLGTLLAFGWLKWCRSDGGVVVTLIKGIQNPLRSPASNVTADCASYIRPLELTS